MFLGRPYRKKRALLLPRLHSTSQTRPSMSHHWREPYDNVPNRERNWLEGVLRSHRAFCGCSDPVLHFTNLVARFNLQGGAASQGGPRNPPPLRRLPALPPAPSTPRPPCPGGDGAAGGGEGRGDGGDGGERAARDEYREDDIEDLLAAIEQDE